MGEPVRFGRGDQYEVPRPPHGAEKKEIKVWLKSSTYAAFRDMEDEEKGSKKITSRKKRSLQAKKGKGRQRGKGGKAKAAKGAATTPSSSPAVVASQSYRKGVTVLVLWRPVPRSN